MAGSKPRKKPYDYTDRLITEIRYNYWSDKHVRRVLRRLVRQAVLRVLPSNAPTEADREYADRIAKELVP
jgi:hypothetical protein